MGGNERELDRAVYLIYFVQFLSTKATGSWGESRSDVQDRAEMDVGVHLQISIMKKPGMFCTIKWHSYNKDLLFKLLDRVSVALY
jgi:hypothetical protein